MRENTNKIPTVSVVLPTFNRSDVLATAIDSVLSQTYSELELLVIDDASSDNTAEILNSYKDTRLRVISLAENVGASAARNIGMKHAMGEFIAFQDSDDEWISTKLEKQVGVLTADHAEAIIAVGCGWSLATGRDGRIPPHPLIGYREIMSGAAGTGSPTLLVRRLDDQPQWDTTLPALEDRDFLLQYARLGTVALVRESLVRVGRGRSDHLATPEKALRSYELMLNKYRTDFAKWPDLRALYHRRASREAAILRLKQLSAEHFRLARRAQPATMGDYLQFSLGLAFGYNGLAAYTRLRRKSGYGAR